MKPIKIEASKRLQAADETKKEFTFVLSGSKPDREVKVEALDEIGAWVGVGLWHKDEFAGVKSVTLKG